MEDREDQQLPPDSPEALVAKVCELRDRVAPLLPDLDPADLIVILQSILRPFGSGRRFLLRQIRPGVYVA
jgi:hypothetical protein